MSLLTVPPIFEPTSSLEINCYEQVAAIGDKPDRQVRISAYADRTIRGNFLRWFLAEAVPSAASPITRVSIERAAIVGALDLDGLSLGFLLSFTACDFAAEVRLSDATIVGLEMMGGSAKEIIADRLLAKGSIWLHASRTMLVSGGPKLSQLRLCGAEIRGNLNLRGCTLEGVPDREGDRVALLADGLTVHGSVLLSDGFRADGEIRLNGCNVHRNLNCSGANLSNPGGFSLSAAGAHIQGTAHFCETKEPTVYGKTIPFLSEGVLRLEGANIEGDLDCEGGQFCAPAFGKGADESEDTDAIAANGLKVGVDFNLRSKNAEQGQTCVRGAVQLISAYIGGDFQCNDVLFDFPGAEPLVADGMTVVGSTFLEGIRTNGLLRFTQADLKQGLFIAGAKFDTAKPSTDWTSKDPQSAAIELGGPACGIYAPDVEVGAEFWWKRIEKIIPKEPAKRMLFWFWAPRARLNSIDDDRKSWEETDRFEVTGWDYDRVIGLTDADVSWRLSLLDRQYASVTFQSRFPDIALLLMRIRRRFEKATPRAGENPSTRESAKDRSSGEAEKRSTLADLIGQFQPQPYLQLAKTIRVAGYESAARRVLTRLERNRTRFSDTGVLRHSWRWLLDGILRYGYSPFRPIIILLIWSVVSAVIFQKAFEDQLIVASKDNRTESAPPHPVVEFNALVYAIDTLVPIVDLNQKKNWVAKRADISADTAPQSRGWLEALQGVWRNRPDWSAGTLRFVNTFLGWLLTTLFAAGVSGLLRTGKES